MRCVFYIFLVFATSLWAVEPPGIEECFPSFTTLREHRHFKNRDVSEIVAADENANGRFIPRSHAERLLSSIDVSTPPAKIQDIVDRLPVSELVPEALFSKHSVTDPREKVQWLSAIAIRLGVDVKRVGFTLREAGGELATFKHQLQSEYVETGKMDPALVEKVEKAKANLQDVLSKALASEIDSVRGKYFDAARELAKRQKVEYSEEDLDKIATFFLRRGLSPPAAKKLLQWSKTPLLEAKTLEDTLVELGKHEVESREQPPIRISRPKEETESTLERDDSPVTFVAEHLANDPAALHTLNVEEYVHRHISRPVMEAVVDNPEIKVKIFEGTRAEALDELARQGFTEVQRLTDNEFTDFTKFMVRNPTTNDAALVIVGASGRAYPREIAAHFLYYSPKIKSSQIEFYRSKNHSPKAEFTRILKERGLDPDIVVMGNVGQLKEIFGDQSVKPVGQVSDANLWGVIYEVNGHQVLSLKVEPHLYSDRAGEFVRALNGLSNKKRKIIFTGTAGALDPRMQVGDLVVPSQFTSVNGLRGENLLGEKGKGFNAANGVVSELLGGKESPGVFLDARHGAVDSILFEGKQWFEAHRKGENALSIVEQETADLAKAASEGNNEFFAFFRISDALWATGEDFSQNESNRPASRAKIHQAMVLEKILERLTSKPNETPTVLPEYSREVALPTAKVKQGQGGGNDIAVIVSTGKSSSYRFQFEGATPSHKIDSRLFDSIRVQLARAVLRDDIQNKSTVDRLAALENIALQFQEKFGFRVVVSAN